MLVAVVCTMYFGKLYAPGSTMTGGQGGEAMEQPQASGDTQGSEDKADTPPEMPSGDQGGTPPAKPEGESSSQQGAGQQGGTPPEMPSGDQGGTPPAKPDGDGGTPPDLPSGEQPGGSQQGGDMQAGGQQADAIGESGWYRLAIYGLESLVIGVLVSFLIISRCNKKKFKESFKGAKKKVVFVCVTVAIMLGGAIGLTEASVELDALGGRGQQSANVEYKAVKTFSENTSLDGGTYESTEADTLAVLVMNKISAVLKNFELNKTGSSDGGDNTSFYGTNSGITAKDGASLIIEGAKILTDASGANGVFSFGGTAVSAVQTVTGDGTEVTVRDSEITTKQDNSGGVMLTGGGILNVINCVIETFGTSSAALRSDRGGGDFNVEGGSYKTWGNGSPAIYCTANINVKDADLESYASEGVVIEGKNSVKLEGCYLFDQNSRLNGQSTTYKNIFLYQSMSGDSAEGTSEFGAKGCTIETANGDTFYVTNTKCVISVEDSKLINTYASGNLLRAQADSWGNSGQNGGDVEFNLTKQSATGNIVIDAISKLVFELTDDSYWEGTLNSANVSQNVSLKLDSSSRIKLTGDSYVSNFEDEDSTLSNIDFNGHKLYVNGSAIN